MSQHTSSEFQQLSVDLGDRAYSIYVGSGVLGHLNLWQSVLKTSEVMLVSNETVASHYLESLQRVLDRPGLKVGSYLLPDGEAHKSLESLNGLYEALLSQGFSRRVVLVALGGGVIGDMVGFAAATYQRGVPVIQVPTTLLSQVDSSVGGKTAVNHKMGKNMIGAFHQPRAVFIDLDTLKTLPRRQLIAGLAEVIKYGLIWDFDFFQWIEEHVEALLNLDELALAHAIGRSCRIKAEIVEKDERESGIRALLNLGHTFGHAIEAGLGYGRWLHGEAVGLGMLMAADLSWRLGHIDLEVLQRVRSLLSLVGLPTLMPDSMSVEDYLGFMRIDKKVVSGCMRFVLLESIGKAYVTQTELDPNCLQQTLDYNVPLGA